MAKIKYKTRKIGPCRTNGGYNREVDRVIRKMAKKGWEVDDHSRSVKTMGLTGKYVGTVIFKKEK